MKKKKRVILTLRWERKYFWVVPYLSQKAAFHINLFSRPQHKHCLTHIFVRMRRNNFFQNYCQTCLKTIFLLLKIGLQVRNGIVWGCFRWSHLICLTLKGLRVPQGTLSSNGLHQVYLKWKIKIIGKDFKRKVQKSISSMIRNNLSPILDIGTTSHI